MNPSYLSSGFRLFEAAPSLRTPPLLPGGSGGRRVAKRWDGAPIRSREEIGIHRVGIYRSGYRIGAQDRLGQEPKTEKLEKRRPLQMRKGRYSPVGVNSGIIIRGS